MSDLKNKLMEKIENREVEMRSRSFFVFAKAAIEVSLFFLLATAIYLINLSFYLPKRDFRHVGTGPRLGMLINIVPWHYVLLSTLGMGIAFWIMYRFTGTYKKHFVIIALIISVTVLAISAVMAFSNFNERVQDRPHLRGIYRMNKSGLGPRDGSSPGIRNLK